MPALRNPQSNLSIRPKPKHYWIETLLSWQQVGQSRDDSRIRKFPLVLKKVFGEGMVSWAGSPESGRGF
jgi:hypothetical protein